MGNSRDTIKGGTRLIFDAVEGVTTTTERVHESIAGTPKAVLSPSKSTAGGHGAIAAMVYNIIRGVNGGLREGVDLSLSVLPPNLGTSSPSEIEAVAALNGICGDHLETSGNALAIDMGFYTAEDTPLVLNREGIEAALPQAGSKLAIMVHGLCMSEIGWRASDETSIGAALENHYGHTPLYLRYNTGRHISKNGREFSQLLTNLIDQWPAPIDSIVLIGHSMGGLVIRSACWYAQSTETPWLHHLEHVVCLGTPHHGSPVAKAGHAIELVVGKIPYLNAFLSGVKPSDGIKDLRHGALLDSDWSDPNGTRPRKDTRGVVPLVPGVQYSFAAAHIGRDERDPIGNLLGDLLVRKDSAAGMHKKEYRELKIAPEHCRVFSETNHFDLLHDAAVTQQVVEWLKPAEVRS
ncbi:MAG: hypothetical protein AAF699_18580 [Pseudomonadota bacterium]